MMVVTTVNEAAPHETSCPVCLLAAQSERRPALAAYKLGKEEWGSELGLY
jgi:hypothetical protein